MFRQDADDKTKAAAQHFCGALKTLVINCSAEPDDAWIDKRPREEMQGDASAGATLWLLVGRKR